MQSNYSSKWCFANFIVIALLPLAFFIFLILGYLGIVPLNVPIHSLILVGFILFIFLIFIKHNANYSICIVRASSIKLNHHIQSSISANEISFDGKSKSILNLEEFMQNYFKNVRNDNFASVASSIFPMLGILGTFIAIALSMPNFAVGEISQLDKEISILLSGVGSAFLASIYGIALSLIWTYFEKRGTSKLENYFEEIALEYSQFIWTQEELQIFKFSSYKNRDREFTQVLKESLNLDFIKEIHEQNLSGFTATMQEVNQNFMHISRNIEKVSNDLKSELHTIQNSNKALSATNSINSSIVEFTKATNSFETTSKHISAQLNTSLVKTFEKIDVEIGEIVTKLADFATHVSLESSKVQESMTQYHEMVKQNARKY